MPSLEALPPQLIRIIFETLDGMYTFDDRVRVPPLVFTCRRFHQILTPTLYRGVRLNLEFDVEKCLGPFFELFGTVLLISGFSRREISQSILLGLASHFRFLKLHHFTSAPAPFEVSFEVRDERRHEIIER
jgi:hypothetical protein